MFSQRKLNQRELATVISLQNYAKKQKQKQEDVKQERQAHSSVESLRIRLNLIEEERKRRFFLSAHELGSLS